MKKGDFLICNDDATTVKVVDFNSHSIFVEYNNEIIERPRSIIGKTLHYVNICWNCQSLVSGRFCKKCIHCGWYICKECDSCHQDDYNCKYSLNGFSYSGFHRNGTRFSDKGYDKEGYDINGYNEKGYNRSGYDKDGYDEKGYNKEGYNREGYDRSGFDKNGYDKDGYDRRGYKNGYDRNGYDLNGYKNGYDRLGFDKNGFNREGYNILGFDRNGYDKNGFNKDGFDINGLNKNGVDKRGLDEYWHTLNTNRIIYRTLTGNSRQGTIIKCYSIDWTNYMDVLFDDGEIYYKISYEKNVEKGIIIPLYNEVQ